MRTVQVIILFLAITMCRCTPPGVQNEMVADFTNVAPLVRAHAHNDYLHQYPLYDALSHGFTSLEADIHLVDGKLYVAHDRENVRDDRTLKKLYLNPLSELVSKNNGYVFGKPIQLTLLVDIKSDAVPTYKKLHELLSGFPEVYTRYEESETFEKGIRVIISGNRAFAYMKEQPVRYAGYDGRLTDLDSRISPSFMPMVSDRWFSHFEWTGDGNIPVEEFMKLENIVNRAHASGYKIRFWGTPDHPSEERLRIWQVLHKTGVDYINTDDLEGLQNFLIKQLED